MGNKTSTANNNTEQIWNNIKTDNMSATVPGLNGLSKDAKQLIANLNLPEFTDAATSEFNVNKILGQVNSNLNEEDKMKFHKILEEMSPASYDNEVLSETSPFISDEMYNKLVNSKTSEDGNEMVGGSFKSSKKNIKGGNVLSHKSTTSSTTSSESLSSLSDSSSLASSSEKKARHDKKHHNKKHDKKKHISSEESVQSGGELSYVSSSAHENENSASEESAVKSITDENNLEETSISVNTSDINMVSDY